MTDEDAEVGGSAIADMTMEWIRFGLTEKEIMSRLRAIAAAYPHRPEPQAALDAMAAWYGGGIAALSAAAAALRDTGKPN